MAPRRKGSHQEKRGEGKTKSRRKDLRAPGGAERGSGGVNLRENSRQLKLVKIQRRGGLNATLFFTPAATQVHSLYIFFDELRKKGRFGVLLWEEGEWTVGTRGVRRVSRLG